MYDANTTGENELGRDLAQIPLGPISNLPNTPRRSQGVFGRFEIGLRGICKISHEAQPSGISRKIARVAIPEDKPKYHEAKPSGILAYPREWQRVQF